MPIHEYPTEVFGIKILTRKQNTFRSVQNEQVIEKQTCLSAKPTLIGGARAGQDTLGFFIPSRHLLARVEMNNTFLSGLDFPHIHPSKGHVLISCQDSYPRGVNTTRLDTDELGKEFLGKAILPRMVGAKRRRCITEGRQGSFIPRVTTAIQQVA